MEKVVQKARTSFNKLTGHAELKNIITEESDVANAYMAVVKKRTDAFRFLNTWAVAGEGELATLVSKMDDVNNKHSLAYTEFAQKYRASYINAFKEILEQQKRADEMVKNVKRAEGKLETARSDLQKGGSMKERLVSKAKGSEVRRDTLEVAVRVAEEELEAAVKERDSNLASFADTKRITLRNAFTAVTQAYIELYRKGGQLMEEQLTAIATAFPADDPSLAFSQLSLGGSSVKPSEKIDVVYEDGVIEG